MSRNLRSLDQLPPRHREEALRQFAAEDAKKLGAGGGVESSPNRGETPDVDKRHAMTSPSLLESGVKGLKGSTGSPRKTVSNIQQAAIRDSESSASPARPPISTDEANLNKTERQFHQWLLVQEVLWTGVQCITLKLAADCRYTPDFVSVNACGRVDFWEVKGFWRDDARVKIKVAARQFPWAKFTAVQWIKGEWKFEWIKP